MFENDLLSETEYTCSRDLRYQNNAGSPLIIRLCYGLEPFLPSGVPQLHFDCFPIDINYFDLEVYANCWYVRGFIICISEAQ
jgi:hypothetical protein